MDPITQGLPGSQPGSGSSLALATTPAAPPAPVAPVPRGLPRAPRSPAGGDTAGTRAGAAKPFIHPAMPTLPSLETEEGRRARDAMGQVLASHNLGLEGPELNRYYEGMRMRQSVARMANLKAFEKAALLKFGSRAMKLALMEQDLNANLNVMKRGFLAAGYDPEYDQAHPTEKRPKTTNEFVQGWTPEGEPILTPRALRFQESADVASEKYRLEKQRMEKNLQELKQATGVDVRADMLSPVRLMMILHQLGADPALRQQIEGAHAESLMGRDEEEGNLFNEPAEYSNPNHPYAPLAEPPTP